VVLASVGRDAAVPELKGRLATLASEGDQFFSVGQVFARRAALAVEMACWHFGRARIPGSTPVEGVTAGPPHQFLADQSLIQPSRRGKRIDRAMQPFRVN
jgi:hypothetical protein